MSAFSKVGVMFDGDVNVPCMKGRKRQAESDELTSEHLTKRQRRFSERQVGGADPKSWRPVHIYRLGSKHWLQNVDNQLQAGTGGNGLSFWKYDSERKGLWAHWYSWQYLCISCDLGPKGLRAMNFIEYSEFVNCDKIPDSAHGCSRDFD